MAECGENYIDCTKHNESVESLFKRLISVDEDGNLSLNICGCCTVFDFISLTPQDDPPADPSIGTIYVDNGGPHVLFWNGEAWIQLDNADPV